MEGLHKEIKNLNFFNNIMLDNSCRPEINDLLNVFSREVKKGLMECKVSSCIHSLRKRNTGSKWFVVSGGNEEELKEVFKARKLQGLFDGGIFGSPRSKEDILNSLTTNNLLVLPVLLLGGSKYDYESSMKAWFDFIFASGWSEFIGWKKYCYKNSILNIDSICDL